MKFRKSPLYHGEFFVALTIPANEDRDVIPCDATPNSDGSYRFQFNILYAYGDICEARAHGQRILADHPTWQAGIYRANTGAFMGAINRAEVGDILKRLTVIHGDYLNPTDREWETLSRFREVANA